MGTRVIKTGFKFFNNSDISGIVGVFLSEIVIVVEEIVVVFFILNIGWSYYYIETIE